MYVTPSPDDLASRLGSDVDPARADFIIGEAEILCSTIVSPLPDGAEVVVRTVATRAFTNPEGITSETVGPYTVQRPSSGLYLTKSDKATLRRLAGGTGAFSIDSMPQGVNAVQLVTVSATGGTFALALTGQSTVPIAFDASSADVGAALGNLSLVGAGNVAVTGEGPYTVTFINDLGTTPIPTLVPNGAGLTGPTPSVTAAMVTRGVYKPGQNLAPWDRDLVRGGYGRTIGPHGY